MFLSILAAALKGMFCFTGSYSNNIFPDPLSSEEEEYYIKKYLDNNDKDARNTLIEHNLRLVAHVVKKYEQTRKDTDDLISIGIIGLIKGIDTYSHKHGTKLATYCARCIDNEILMYFRNDKKNSKNISIDEKVGFDKDGNEKIRNMNNLEENDTVVRKYDRLSRYKYFLVPRNEYEEKFEGEKMPKLNEDDYYGTDEISKSEMKNDSNLDSISFPKEKFEYLVRKIKLCEGYSKESIDELIDEILDINGFNKKEVNEDELESTVKK